MIKLINNPIQSLLSLYLFTALLSGCSGITIAGKDGATHHLIIGLGVVSTPKNNNENGVLASRTKALGLYASNQPGLKIGAGLSSSSTISVPDNSENVVIEMEEKAFGQISIEVNP